MQSEANLGAFVDLFLRFFFSGVMLGKALTSFEFSFFSFLKWLLSIIYVTVLLH